jgi:hypothetical protein
MSDSCPNIRVVDRADPAAVRHLTDALYSFNAAAPGIDDGRELFAELRDLAPVGEAADGHRSSGDFTPSS